MILFAETNAIETTGRGTYTCTHAYMMHAYIGLNVELGCLCTKCATPEEARRGHAWDWSYSEL